MYNNSTIILIIIHIVLKRKKFTNSRSQNQIDKFSARDGLKQNYVNNTTIVIELYRGNSKYR